MARTLNNAVNVIRLPALRTLYWQERLINQFASFTQFITWPFLFIVFNLTFKLRITGKENFNLVKSPFLIISDHIAFYDSFIFRLILGPITPHLPLRFMAVTKFQWKYLNNLAKIGIIDLIYSLFGVFTITQGLGISKNLEKAREIIQIGGNVVMYPEGKIAKGNSVGPFKQGAAVLMKETGVSMIPVSFRLGERGWLRKKLYVNIGKPKCASREASVEQITEQLHQEIETLYAIK